MMVEDKKKEELNSKLALDTLKRKKKGLFGKKVLVWNVDINDTSPSNIFGLMGTGVFRFFAGAFIGLSIGMIYFVKASIWIFKMNARIFEAIGKHEKRRRNKKRGKKKSKKKDTTDPIWN